MYQSRSKVVRFAVSVTIAAGLIAAGAGAKNYVAAFIRLHSFNISAYSILAGATTMGVVTLDSATSRSITPMTFRSSNTAVATVPASRTILGTSMPVPVTAIAAGCVELTATLGSKSSTDVLVVQPAAKTASFTFTVSDPMVIYGYGRPASVQKPLSVGSTPTRDATASGTLAPSLPYVALSSSNPAVASVPERQALTALGRANFNVMGVSPGCAIITARIGTETLSKTVQVVDIGG